MPTKKIKIDMNAGKEEWKIFLHDLEKIVEDDGVEGVIEAFYDPELQTGQD
jgi:hypothetical protein|tara:strand:- start:1237 stop:1389 length:153 start_codon:yes stop_codon:yes gene_type:complete